MRALVLGVGLQGRAVVHDLQAAAWLTDIVAADIDDRAVAETLRQLGCTRARAMAIDASAPESLTRAVQQVAPDVVICMLPPVYQFEAAEAALCAGSHFVSTSYAGRLPSLHEEALRRGLILLPEMGFDPGVDLVLAHAAVDRLDDVQGLQMFGGGIPEHSAATNSLRYKITWTFDGVLSSYVRPARLLQDGCEVVVPGEHIFQRQHVTMLDVPDVGTLEAFPNGNALAYREIYRLSSSLRDLGRFALRWPGHCAFWQVLVDLGFLREEPLQVGQGQVAPRTFVSRLLEPQLQFGSHERDLAILRVNAWGRQEGRPRRVEVDLLDHRDLRTGLYAMNRTVGYTASIGAQMILQGRINGAGLLSPARDVPVEPLIQELRARGMVIRLRESESPMDDGSHGSQAPAKSEDRSAR